MANTNQSNRVESVRGEAHVPHRQARESLKAQILAEYDKLARQHPKDVDENGRGFKPGTTAERHYLEWYNRIREGKVRTGPREGDRMDGHAKWHLRVSLRDREKAAA